MAEIIRIHRGDKEVGLRDADTLKSLPILKAVDVTEDCPGANKQNRCLFLYYRAQRGKIIQIVRPLPGRKFLGSCIEFLINDLGNEVLLAPGEGTFEVWANNLGLPKARLRSLIKKNAPTWT